MRPSLAGAILQLYGESPVLDPMAGISTTLVEAMLLEMNAVDVEYEKKFVHQANENIKHVRKLFPNIKLGKAVCVQGDARKLSLVQKKKEVKSILFSPPYWKAMKSQTSSEEDAVEKYLSSVKHARKVGGKPISKALAKSNIGYVNSRENIGNIEEFGSIFFSPPYFNAIKKEGEGPHAGSERISYEERVKRFQGYSTNPGNIGNVSKFGSIVFSPPYFDALSLKKGGGSKTSILHEDHNEYFIL